MRILDTMRTQSCVYWAPAGESEYGQRVYGEPVELRVRWEDTTELYVGKDASEKVSRAKVFLGEDVREEGVLWLGKLSDVEDESNPFALPGAWVIQRFDKVPTLKGDEFVRIAYL